MKVWLVRKKIIILLIFSFYFLFLQTCCFPNKKEEVIKEKELNNIEIDNNDIFNKNNCSNSLDGQSKQIHS